jgi:hypothetical protein
VITPAFIKKHKLDIRVVWFSSIFNLAVCLILWFQRPYTPLNADKVYAGFLGVLLMEGMLIFAKTMRMKRDWAAIEKEEAGLANPEDGAGENKD